MGARRAETPARPRGGIGGAAGPGATVARRRWRALFARLLRAQPGPERSGGTRPNPAVDVLHPARLVRRRRKSRMMYWPSVMVLVKDAFPRAMADTWFTNATRYGSRASMKVLIRIPLLRHAPTSRKVSRSTTWSSPIAFL